MKRTPVKLPADVEADQVWKAPDGQHFKVHSVHNGIASLHRCSPAGRVLNQRYRISQQVERMQTEFELVSGGNEASRAVAVVDHPRPAQDQRQAAPQSLAHNRRGSVGARPAGQGGLMGHVA